MRRAAALRYERGKNQAPEVVASGQGWVAEQILEIARQNQIPFYQHAELVEALLKLPVGAEIPPELYGLTAQVLSFVLRLDKEESGHQGGDGNC